MKHRIGLGFNVREQQSEHATQLGCTDEELGSAIDYMLANDLLFEDKLGEFSLLSIDVESKIEQPLIRRLFALYKKKLPTRLVPLYGKNLQTLQDRWLRAWEQAYNILINKIPSHHVRIWWLRAGGAKIGKGSSVWRNTEVLGVENLVIGNDSVVAWHCLLDARAGLVIGDHVAIASYVHIIAGSHDLQAPEFWSVSAPIYIEDYVWVASRALIGHGSRLGRGCVVTACTVVAKEILPYKIVGGSGAKPMGERPHDLNYRVGGKGLFTLFH